MHSYSMDLGGRTLTIEAGKIAKQANGAVLVRYGDTAVVVAVTGTKTPREGVDFFPLTVDFEEKMYAVGKIPGGFIKREGRPSEQAILTSRLIDRPIRPMFPEGYHNDVQIVATAVSVDPDNAPDMPAMIGASCALSISDIPFEGPIAGVRVGLIDGEFIINPTVEQAKISQLNLAVAGTKDAILMVEAGANEVSEETMLDAIWFGHGVIKQLVEFQEKIVAEIGKEKMEVPFYAPPEEMVAEIEEYGAQKLKDALMDANKLEREENVAKVKAEIAEVFLEKYPDNAKDVAYITQKLVKKIVRRTISVDKIRPDGRQLDEVRPVSCEVGLLARPHGSSLFTRGQTQVLTVATLGPVSDSQKLDGLDEETSKRYMHQYNFPSYSVGETKPSRGPGRREIGHGALAERALIPVLPTVEEFPYAMRLVSEVLSSNGSTSQASICGSTLALMDAGVPIHAPVAGISCGLITLPNSDEFKTMVDIQGLEDFYGDMDFKVGGTKKGITAIQVDIKVDGLTPAIIAEAFEKTRKARLYILDEIMLKAIPAPRDTVGEFAPKMLQIKIPTDKIRDVIGQGGKVIQKMSAECGVKIDVNEDGHVFISGISMEGCRKAYQMIETIAIDPEVGSIYKGKVVSIKPFGAFVEIAPGRDGLVHISKLDKERVEQVEDVVSVGDAIIVKVMDIKDGKISLSRKDALEELEARRKQQETE